MDPYRLDEVPDVWQRFIDQAWSEVAASEIPYRLAALLIVAKRARATEDEIRAYLAQHDWAGEVAELNVARRRLANIRHAARAAHGALAVRVNRYVSPWPPDESDQSESEWVDASWFMLRGWSQ